MGVRTLIYVPSRTDTYKYAKDTRTNDVSSANVGTISLLCDRQCFGWALLLIRSASVPRYLSRTFHGALKFPFFPAQ